MVKFNTTQLKPQTLIDNNSLRLVKPCNLYTNMKIQAHKQVHERILLMQIQDDHFDEDLRPQGGQDVN